MAATLRTSSLTKQTSNTTTMSAAIPATAEDGDIVVAIHNSVNRTIVGPPSGWTLIGATHGDGSGQDNYTQYMWKVVDGDAGTNYTFERSSTYGVAYMTVGMFVVQGADTAIPIPASTLHGSTGNSNDDEPLVFDDITVSRAGSLLIAAAYGGSSNNHSVSGFTDAYEQMDNPSSVLKSYAATKEQASAGTISTQVDISGGSNLRTYTWALLAVQAAPEPKTKEKIQSGNADLAFVLEIEGYENLVTSWHDTDAIVTAYAGTDWSSALGGLRVTGEFTQEIRPLNPEIDSGSMTFFIGDDQDGNDTFGKDVFSAHKNTGGATPLTATADNDDVTINVLASAELPSATDYAYIGTERIEYTGTGASTLTGCTRGYNSPFAVDGGTRFGRWHAIGETQGEMTYQPPVTDWKRVWHGSYVALRVLRVVDGVADSRGEGHLLFAGTISDIQDTPAGLTQLVAVDIRKQVADTMLLADQYSAEPLEGVVLTSSDKVMIRAWGRTTGGSWTVDDPLTIDSSDLGTGRKTAQEVIDAIADAIDAAGLTHDWTVERDADDHVVFRVAASTATYDFFDAWIVLSPRVAWLLGFELDSATLGDLGYKWDVAISNGSDPTSKIRSNYPTAYFVPVLASGDTLSVTSATGTFVNQGDQVPEPLKSKYNTDDGSMWGFLRYRDVTFLAKQDGDDFEMYYDVDVLRLFEQAPIVETDALQIVRDGDPIPRATQVLFFEERFSEMIPRIFASTGTSGYNHATYDEYDRQLGCAIPWELLGDAFLESARSIAEVGDTVVALLLDKPTKLVDILIPELALRNAHIVFKEGLRFSRPSGAFSVADHTLTDSTMAVEPDRAKDERPLMQWSRSQIMNVLKVEYNRSVDDEYQNTIEVRNQTSISEYGVHSPITISARNTMTIGKTTDPNAIHALVAQLSGDLLAIYDEPLQVVTVAVSGDVLIDVAPGDSVSLSSSFIRYHGDGARQVANVAAYVIRSTFDLTAMRGEVTLVLTGAELARAALFSPAAKIDETASSGGFTAGYDSAGPTIKLKANEFSNAADDDDITHFTVSDAVRIVEKSPATPGSPQSWTTTITAIDEENQEVDLNDALTGFDTSKEYYLVSDNYGSAATSQKTDTYMADNADDKINDDERSRTYRDNDIGIVLKDPIGSTDVRHEFPPTDGSWWDENRPLHPAMLQALIRSVTNLVSHGCIPQCPAALVSEVQFSGTVEGAVLAPMWLPLRMGFARSRVLRVGPRIRSASGIGNITLTVYSSAVRPVAAPGAADLNTFEFRGPSRSVSWTHGSTTADNKTAKNLVLVPAKSQLGTWITVMGTGNALDSGYVLGFHTWYVKEVA